MAKNKKLRIWHFTGFEGVLEGIDMTFDNYILMYGGNIVCQIPKWIGKVLVKYCGADMRGETDG